MDYVLEPVTIRLQGHDADKHHVDTLTQESQSAPSIPNLDRIIDKAVSFISNLKAVWMKGNMEQKEMVLHLAFSDRLRFRPGVGFKTADISMPFSVLKGRSHALVLNGGR